jgi:hypothetical protein
MQGNLLTLLYIPPYHMTRDLLPLGSVPGEVVCVFALFCFIKQLLVRWIAVGQVIKKLRFSANS